MSDTRLKHQLKIITIPVFIEIALVMLLGAVDTVMLSRYSDNSVAAVGLDNQLVSRVFLVYLRQFRQTVTAGSDPYIRLVEITERLFDRQRDRGLACIVVERIVRTCVLE